MNEETKKATPFAKARAAARGLAVAWLAGALAALAPELRVALGHYVADAARRARAAFDPGAV